MNQKFGSEGGDYMSITTDYLVDSIAFELTVQDGILYEILSIGPFNIGYELSAETVEHTNMLNEALETLVCEVLEEMYGDTWEEYLDDDEVEEERVELESDF
jgi:hypothetical protein